MNRIIEEIKTNLEIGNFLSALALALILPDICGKISYPNIKHGGKRYQKWYNEYIYPYERSPIEEDPHNEWVPDGYAIYKLRCNLFHDGSLNIDRDIKDNKEIEESDNYNFIITDSLNSNNLVWKDKDKTKTPDVLIRVSVKDLCTKICAVVENVYLENYSNKEVGIENDIVIFDF